MKKLIKNMKPTSVEPLVIYCDGFLSNADHKIEKTGGCSVGITWKDKLIYRHTFPFPNKRPYTKTKKITVPMMEYFAVYKAMQFASFFISCYELEKIIVYSDAETVVNQLNDRWVVNNKILKMWHKLVKGIFPERTMLLWIKRGANVKVLGH